MRQVLMAQQLQEFCDALVQKHVDAKLNKETLSASSTLCGGTSTLPDSRPPIPGQSLASKRSILSAHIGKPLQIERSSIFGGLRRNGKVGYVGGGGLPRLDQFVFVIP